MTNEEYAEQTAKLVNAWRSYASNPYDHQSQQMVHEDIVTHMHKTGVQDYSVAMKSRREQIRRFECELSTVDIGERPDDPGSELDRIAARNRELDPTLSYNLALRYAILENPRLGAKYTGRPIPLDRAQEVQEYFDKRSQVRRYDVSPAVVCANIVTGVPRLSDGSIDVQTAVRALNAFGGDTLQRAAMERLEQLTKDEIAQSGEPASEVMKPAVMESIKRKVRTRFTELADVAEGAAMNDRALRSLLPQLFR
jgi:hypothetical protein